MKYIEFITRIIAWSGALSVEATQFWRIAQEHDNLALTVTLGLIWLSTLVVMSVDLSGKLKSRHLVTK